MTNYISSTYGCHEAPANLLLAVAHGLATAQHWWLWSPADRGGLNWTLPRPRLMYAVKMVHEELVAVAERDSSIFPPRIIVNGFIFEWKPLNDLMYPGDGRKVIIRVKGVDALAGTIEWNSGTGQPSTFIASILAILPGAVDDGKVAELVAERDQQWAREIKTILEAQASGYRGDMYTLDGKLFSTSSELSREREYFFHLGYNPRRSWTIAGEEKRFARWLKRAEMEAMVYEAEHLLWLTYDQAKERGLIL